mmetsp:Transcript_31199/g.83010  ORF Transcript_31199/g.83010 Transcript_31199/m.83010 type:complete len:227 (+) Transcript_31199:679-1359(+)
MTAHGHTDRTSQSRNVRDVLPQASSHLWHLVIDVLVNLDQTIWFAPTNFIAVTRKQIQHVVNVLGMNSGPRTGEVQHQRGAGETHERFGNLSREGDALRQVTGALPRASGIILWRDASSRHSVTICWSYLGEPTNHRGHIGVTSAVRFLARPFRTTRPLRVTLRVEIRTTCPKWLPRVRACTIAPVISPLLSVARPFPLAKTLGRTQKSFLIFVTCIKTLWRCSRN